MNVSSTPATPENQEQGLVLVVSAPSGAGKTTVVDALLAERIDLGRAVTHTTRAPRPGERDGIDYHFVSADEFTCQDAQGAFLEQAEIYGNRYGTSWREVESCLAAGEDVVLVIDWQGARSVREKLAGNAMIRLFTVFVMPPSLDVLEQRLSDRNTESPEQLQRRLGMAREEMAHASEYDARVVNDRLDDCVEQISLWMDQIKEEISRR